MRRHLTVSLILALSISTTMNRAIGQSAVQSKPDTDGALKDQRSEGDITELQRKAEAGDSSAAYALGNAYETGKVVPRNLAQAALWYRKAADQGNAKAQSSLGVLYWLGEGVEKDKNEAVKWYRKAAFQGDANAMFNLGMAYYNGEGVRTNEALAHAWFLLSSEAGSAAGRDAAKRSEAERTSRGLGDVYIAIGEMYEKGEDLPQNSQLAIAWYKKAATGDPGLSLDEGEARLAHVYLTAGNYAEARPWCEAAAKNGFRGSAFCMGYLYQRGLGVKQDLGKAFRWYEQAAAKGQDEAMCALGQMYLSGQGVKVDRIKAMSWFLSSARVGNNEALAAARQLRPSMSEHEWKVTAEGLRHGGFDPQKVDAYLRRESTQAAH